MSIDRFGEPQPDPRIGEALRHRGLADPRVADEELRARIMRAARPELARMARGRPWWEWMAAWSRVAVPVGLAASLAAGALLARTGSATSTSGDTESSVMLSAAAGAGGGAELGDRFVAQANDSWLLSQALGQ
jgi:hypothetical protein